MRDNCTELRDLAIIDILASTGMYVGEMVLLNRNDVDFNEGECIVFGKGSKERVVYFDARTKIHLQNYISGRTDYNHALFVSLKAPYERLKIRGVEVRLREYGKKLGFYENEELIAISKELTDTLRKNKTIDWQRRESARAKMRMLIKNY